MPEPLPQRTRARPAPDSFADNAVPRASVVRAQNDGVAASSEDDLLADSATTPSSGEPADEAKSSDRLAPDNRGLVEGALRLVAESVIDGDGRMVLALDGEDDEPAAVGKLRGYGAGGDRGQPPPT